MLLAGRGYRVIGADLSEDMLAEAERKARELPEGSRPFSSASRCRGFVWRSRWTR